MMISQHWLMEWLGAVRQQAIPWANIDLDVCRHMASLGRSAFKKDESIYLSLLFQTSS